MKTLFITTLMPSFPGVLLIAEEPWVIESPADWKKAQALAKGITVEEDTTLRGRDAGHPAPPHKFQRAELPHWAPTSGVDAQTLCLP